MARSLHGRLAMRGSLAAGALLVSAVIAPVAAQDAVWSLTPDDVAIYARDPHWAPVALDGKASVSSGGHPDHVPPVLEGSALDGGRLQRTTAVCDLYDLLPCLAFDLTTWKGGRIDRVFRRVPWFGDVQVTGRAARPDRQGNQTLRLTIRSNREMELGDASDEFARQLRWYFDERIDGELRIDRTFDAERGLVTTFRAELDVKMVDTKAGKGELRKFGLSGHETWTLDRVLQDGAEFRKRVNDAIDKGVAREKDALEKFELSSLVADEGRGNFQGPTLHALMLFALARAGVSYQDPVVAASLDKFAGREFSHTNTLALGVLAIDAFYASPTERAAVVAGEVAGRPERKLPARERQWITEWATRILGNLDPEAWEKGYAEWRFVPDGFADTDTAWLSLEALNAAERCGVRVPFDVWPAAARWFVDTQRPSGIVVKADVRYLKGGGTPGDVEASGWNDHAQPEWEQCHGAPTAEALAALALCRAHLQGNAEQAELRARVDTAIDCGLAWLAHDFTTHYDPAPLAVYHQHGDDLRLAMPFALERLMVTRVHGGDWYFDGACSLLAAQRADGRMGDNVTGTAIALTFLRRTAAGPVTGWRDR